jgi:PhzF family phenazine biosynthesis protein
MKRSGVRGTRVPVPLYRVDAFVGPGFQGNPAGVCFPPTEVTDEWMLEVAAHVGASETAFVRPQGGAPLAKARSYELRWFTPSVEVPLCGHATLATAAVLFGNEKVSSSELLFETKSGTLEARKEGDRVLLDFPSDPPQEREAPKAVLEALGIPAAVGCAFGKMNRKLLLLLQDAASVRDVKPAFGRLKSAAPDGDIQGVIVTAPGEGEFDFVSRYFGPWVGIDEDPVTGSAHTVLGPYWAARLGKKELRAAQLSRRGGALTVRVRHGRVDLLGMARVGQKEMVEL